jgi:Mrp family chromosome partitioning ATPase
MGMTKRNGNRILIKRAVSSPPDRTHQKTAIYPKHRFLFVSSIGGVGKTSVLLNIALDYLFADTPPGSGKVLRSAIRCMPDTKIIIVSAPHKISAAHAQKMINFLRKEKIQLFGWIENMRGFLCQGCNQRQELFSTGTGNRAIFLAEVPFLGRIPIDPHIVDCADAGPPYLEKYQNSEAAIAFNQVAEKILRFCAAEGAESDENISLRKGRKR